MVIIMRKVKVELDEDVVLYVNSLKKNIGETYSDILRRELKMKK